MLTRRQLLKAGAVGGAALLVPWEATTGAWAAIPGGSLDPTTIDKYVAPLVVPPVMPPLTGARNQAMDRYAIAVRQFRQQILPPGLPATTVWSYGSAPHRGSFHYPAFTIEARVDRPAGSSGATTWSTATAAICPTCCRSIRPCTGPTHPAASTGGTAAPGSAGRPVPTGGRCRS